MIRRSGRDNILQRADHRLGRESVADRIATGALFAFFGSRTSALARIVPVGLDLPEGGHCGPAPAIGFVSPIGLRLAVGR
jgi:hypothetical protein